MRLVQTGRATGEAIGMTDVWTGLVQGVLAFGETRASNFVGTTFSDSGSFITSIFTDAPSGPAWDSLKDDVDNLSGVVQPVIPLITPKINAAKVAAQNMATELQTDPFTIEAAGRAATELAFLMIASDEALTIVATELSKNAAGVVQPAIKNAIEGITEPWKAPFRDVAAGLGGAFDDIVEQLFGMNNASQELGDALTFDRANKELRFEIAQIDHRDFGVFNLQQMTLLAFFNYKDKANVGLRFRTKMQAGLRSDKLLEKVIPNGANPTAESTMIQLDSDDGLTFGPGKNRKLTLPVSFSFPGIELREFAIALPNEDEEEADDRFEVTATLAAKLGDALGIVVEGAGVTVRWDEASNDHLEFSPRLPDGLGVRVNAGIVSGGGFIRREDNEYSGILDLKIGDFRITAIGLMVTDPFSFVVILSVQFSPAIDLGLGFTLNGLGGILAVERRVSTDELRKGIRDGTAATLLFPKNPIDAANTILEKVKKVFPAQEGAFAVGPIGELGWGSQAGFVKAKVGIILSLPDPKLIILGAIEIGVPSTKVPDGLKIVDLKAEVYGEFTPEYMLVLIGISNSKLAGISVSGDMGIYIRWAGGADFAISVGGFFPGYEAPAVLQGLRKITVDLSPAKWLSLRAEGYFAITTNSLQFGAGIHLNAKLGPVKGKGWLTLDALFRWAPRFYFEVRITAGLSISAFGFDLFGVDFKGTLKGTNPWSIEGYASVSVLWWDIEFDLGPFTWGDSDSSTLPSISAIGVVAEALEDDEVWKPILPAGTETLVKLIEDDQTPLLVHPLGSLEVKQAKLPLETNIERIGQSRPDAKRVNLAAVRLEGVDANLVSHAEDLFAPGQFMELSEDEQVSRPSFESMPAGMKVVATSAPSCGPSSSVSYEWETAVLRPDRQWHFLSPPHAVLMNARMKGAAVRAGAVSIGARNRGNAYAQQIVDEIELSSSKDRVLRFREDLGAVSAEANSYNYTTAIELADAHTALNIDAELELVAPGALA